MCFRPELDASTWRPSDVHAVPNARTGEGVSDLSLPDAKETGGARASALSQRATDQDLVPEQANETEERTGTDRGTQYGRQRWPTPVTCLVT